MRFSQVSVGKFEVNTYGSLFLIYFSSFPVAISPNLCPLVIPVSKTELTPCGKGGIESNSQYLSMLMPYPKWRLPSSVGLLLKTFQYKKLFAFFPKIIVVN